MFHNTADRTIEVRVDDRDTRRRAPDTPLAPFGAAIQHPTSLMLVWMRRFDLLRVTGREPEIRIDGRRVATGRLPGEWIHRRRLIKWADGLAVVRLNSMSEGNVAVADRNVPGAVQLDATRERVVALDARGGDHRARFEMSPGLADVERLPEGAMLADGWRLGIDGTPEVVGGSWRATRQAERVELSLEVTRGWRPAQLPRVGLL